MANIKNLQTLKYHVFSTKNIISSYYHEDEKIFKEEESIEILRSLGLIIQIEKYQKNV